MSDTTEDDATEPGDDPTEPVRVELILPAGLVSEYDDLVRRGIYLSRGDAIRHAIVTGWRHDHGSFHTVRLDFLDKEDKRPDTGGDVAPETEAPEGGDGEAEEDES